MKICISNKRKDISSPKTGKGYFVARLVKEFAMMGIEVTADPDNKCDIYLGIGKFEYDHKGCKKRVLRLGDLAKDTNMNYKMLNKRKKIALHQADGVIYQSKYSKRLCNAFLGKAKVPTEIIFNGADPKEFDVSPHESPYKYNFLASTRKWTRQKRIHQIWDAFLEAGIPDSCLWICGIMENKLQNEVHYDNHRAVRYLDIVSQERLASLYKLCDAMIDITWLSACPNNVVEALVAGCRVICTNQAGARELIKCYLELDGLGILDDKPYNFKPVNLNKPSKIDIKRLSGYIRNSIKIRNVQKSEHLHISTIAQKYKEFFERILNG